MNDKSSHSDKTTAIKEIHNIEKTKVLLLRDLPFIARLSQYYDLNLFNSSLSNKFSNSNSIDNKIKPISNLSEKDHKNVYQNFENKFNYDEIKDAIATITGSKLDVDNNNNKPRKYKNIDDPVLEEM